jgi:creatinine amidohydrolase
MDDRDLYFANLTWPEIEAARTAKRTTVLLLPVGSTEPHGPHGPLSTDVLISDGTCVRAARTLAGDPDLRALVLPSFDYAVTRYAGAFAGAVHIGEEAFEAVVVDVCSSLIADGFRHLAIVNNHFEPRHVQAIHRCVERIESEHDVLVGFVDLTRRERALRLTEEFRRAECHAGRYETSLVLADHPELVDERVMRTLPYVPVDMASGIAAGARDFLELGMDRAYCGSPAEATAAEGEESYAALADMLVEAVRELVAGVGGRDRPGRYGRV